MPSCSALGWTGSSPRRAVRCATWDGVLSPRGTPFVVRRRRTTRSRSGSARNVSSANVRSGSSANVRNARSANGKNGSARGRSVPRRRPPPRSRPARPPRAPGRSHRARGRVRRAARQAPRPAPAGRSPVGPAIVPEVGPTPGRVGRSPVGLAAVPGARSPGPAARPTARRSRTPTTVGTPASGTGCPVAGRSGSARDQQFRVRGPLPAERAAWGSPSPSAGAS